MAVPAHSYINTAGHTTEEALECLRRDLIAGDARCDELHRAVVWQALLLQNRSEPYGPEVLETARTRVRLLRDAHLLEKPDEAFDPLSESESWRNYYKNQDLQNEIKQDCERIFPEEEWFQDTKYQLYIRECLFIWCKDNPDISYRQGMHELAGIIVWVVVHDSTYLEEHGLEDIFALFNALMGPVKHFYTSSPAGTANLLQRSRRIQGEILPIIDQKLAERLSHLSIEPQLYCIKWLRLLFSREFPFDAILVLWDALFAADPSLDLVDHICCALLLRIRRPILEEDYNVALTTLLRFPGTETSPGSYVQDAVYLRSHLTSDGGSKVIEKYNAGCATGAQDVLAKGTLPSTYSISALLEQTDKLGINHYVRGAVEEVRRNVTPIITETRHAINRTNSRESSSTSSMSASSSSPTTAERDRELASILALTITQLRSGGDLSHRIARLEDVKLVLQGRKTIADISQPSVGSELKQTRPYTAPSILPVSTPQRMTASPIKIPAIRSKARSPCRLAAYTDAGSHGNSRDEIPLSITPKKASLKKAADYSFLFDSDKPLKSTFNQARDS